MRTILIPSILLLLLVNFNSFGQFHEGKSVLKVAKFSPVGVLSIDNKYGDITIRSWDKDSIRIKAKIKLSSKSRDRLAQLKKRSQVAVYLNDDFADVKTVIDESTLAKEWRNIKNMASSGGDQIRVVYTIDVPKSVKLEIKNRFGNTYVSNHDGRINIDSEHGDVRMGNVENLERLEVSFGKVYVREVRRLRMNLAFADADIGNANSIKIDSKSSSIFLGEITNFSIRSTRDKVKIKKVERFHFTGSLSKIEIEQLNGQINATMKYTKLWVQEVGADFTALRVDPKHCSVYLNFSNKDKVKTTIRGADIVIDYDKGMGVLEQNGYVYRGYMGTDDAKEKTLLISGEKSTFTIDFEKNKF